MRVRYAICLICLAAWLCGCGPRTSAAPPTAPELFIAAIDKAGKTGRLPEDGESAALQAARAIPGNGDRLLALVYLAARRQVNGQFELPLLEEAQSIAQDRHQRVPPAAIALLARLWILAELPWRARDLLAEAGSSGRFDYVALASGHDFSSRLIRRIVDQACAAADTRVDDSTATGGARALAPAPGSSQTTCGLTLGLSDLSRVALADDEDLRRYGLVVVANDHGTEEPDFAASPWKRVLHAPPFTVRIGAIVGMQENGDLEPAAWARSLQLSESLASAGRIDPVPQPEAVAVELQERMQSRQPAGAWLNHFDATPVVTRLAAAAPGLRFIRSAILSQHDSSDPIDLPAIGTGRLPKSLLSLISAAQSREVLSLGVGFAIVLRSETEQLAIFCDDPGSGRVLLLRSDAAGEVGWAHFSLHRLSGDPRPHLFYEFIQGTASTLDVYAFSGESETPALQRRGIPHGQMTVTPIDVNGHASVLLAGVIERFTIDCNQCPAIRGSELYVLSDSATRSLEFQGALKSQGEAEVTGSNGAVLADFNSGLELMHLIRPGAGTTTAPDKPPRTYSDDRLGLFKLLKAASRKHDSETGLLAISLAQPVLDRGSSLPNQRDDATLLALWKSRFELMGGNIDASIATTNAAENRFGDVILKSDGLRQDLLSLRVDQALSLNRFSDARHAMDGVRDPSPLGREFAAYYIAVGDRARATEALTAYVEHAFSGGVPEDSDGFVETLVALARLQAQGDSEAAAQDYLFSAARWCRTLLHSTCPRVFSAAGELYGPKYHESSMAFYRESIANLGNDVDPALMSEILSEWLAFGDDAGDDRLNALEFVYDANKKTAPDISIRAATTASSILEAAADYAGALSWSARGLLALDEGRRRFTDLSEQLSFIHRDVQYARHIRLLDSSRAGAEAYLWGAETIKLQAFRDSIRRRSRLDAVPPLEPAAMLRSIQSRLASNEAFMTFLFGPDSGYRVLVFKDAPPKVEHLAMGVSGCGIVTRAVMRRFSLGDPENISEFRSGKVSKQTMETLSAAGKAFLSRMDLPRAVDRLLISQDSCQAGLPWAALTTESGRYLVDQYAVATVLPLPTLVAPSPSRTAIIIAAHRAAPWESGYRVPEELANLPRIRSDVSSLNAAIGRSGIQVVDSVLDGRSASDGAPLSIQRQLQRMSAAGVVHISSHGLFDSRDPGRSAIVLDDGFFRRLVTADDLGAVSLATVRLLVLSSCESGSLISLPAGEPGGFVRSAIAAGVQTGVFAGWQVDDGATDSLFGRFYSRLDLDAASTSLRRAQLDLKSTRPHPYFWAGFGVVAILSHDASRGRLDLTKVIADAAADHLLSVPGMPPGRRLAACPEIRRSE